MTDLTPAVLDPRVKAVARWALAEAAIASGTPARRLPEPAASVLGAPPAAWELAAAQVSALAPATVVVAGTLAREGAAVLDAARDAGATCVAVLPVADPRVPLDDGALELLTSADRAIATSGAERALLEGPGGAVHEIATIVSVQTERVGDPPACLEPGGYVCVVDPAGDWALALDAAVGDAAVLDAMAALSGALDLAVVAPDGGSLLEWRGGRPVRTATVRSRRDLWDVLASARVAVSVGNDTTYGRGALECMLLATPLVAVAGSCAGALVSGSGGGMVAERALDLPAVTRTLCTQDRTRAGVPDGGGETDAAVLGRAAQHWAAARFADHAAFEARVLAAHSPGPLAHGRRRTR